jgi:hypothetical protein
MSVASTTIGISRFSNYKSQAGKALHNKYIENIKIIEKILINSISFLIGLFYNSIKCFT